MGRKADPGLVTLVLDDLVQLGIIAKWCRRVIASAGPANGRRVADIYDISLGAPATAEDEAALRDFLERHGWTVVGHAVDVRIERPLLKSDPSPSLQATKPILKR
jgi:hypothetical protein